YSLGRLAQRPFGSFLTIAVIGITLALPAALHVLLNNVSALSYSWERSVQASLFLASDVTDTQGRALATRIADDPQVAHTHYISRADALAEFSRLSGLGDALESLQHNPLPAVIAVQPKADLSAADARAQVERLGTLPQVEQAQMDQQWLER